MAHRNTRICYEQQADKKYSITMQNWLKKAKCLLKCVYENNYIYVSLYKVSKTLKCCHTAHRERQVEWQHTNRRHHTATGTLTLRYKSLHERVVPCKFHTSSRLHPCSKHWKFKGLHWSMSVCPGVRPPSNTSIKLCEAIWIYIQRKCQSHGGIPTNKLKGQLRWFFLPCSSISVFEWYW